MRVLRLVWSYAAETVVVVLMAIMVAAVAVQVFFRFVIGDPLSWTEELARYAFVWITFLGAAVAYRHRAHIVVDIMLHLVPTWARAPLSWVVEGLVAVTLVILIREGLRMVETTSNVQATMLQIPMSYIYAAIPVSAALMLVYQVERLVGVLRSRRPASAEAELTPPKLPEVGGV